MFRLQNSSTGSRNSAISSPTCANLSKLCPTGSTISLRSAEESCHLRRPTSGILATVSAEHRADASVNRNVRLRQCGASSRTLSRCATVIVMIRSAAVAACGVSCRAIKPDASPPREVSTSAAEGCIACPITAWVPALDAFRSHSPNRDA